MQEFLLTQGGSAGTGTIWSVEEHMFHVKLVPIREFSWNLDELGGTLRHYSSEICAGTLSEFSNREFS